MVNGDKEAVDAILEDPDIQAVSFVGSSAIAEYVYSRGTAHGKRVQAMGGAKNHAIIMPDADLDQVANELIGAGYGSAGERCMAISVAVPVTDKIADALVERLKPRVEALRIGAAHRSRCGLRPAGDRSPARRKVPRLYRDGREGRRRSLWSMAAVSNCRVMKTASIMGGSLFDHVTPHMQYLQEEIFGPVLQIARAKDFDEAISLPYQSPIWQWRRHIHARWR